MQAVLAFGYAFFSLLALGSFVFCLSSMAMNGEENREAPAAFLVACVSAAIVGVMLRLLD